MNAVVQPLTVSVTEVWAQLWLSSSDCMRIRDLLVDENLVKPSSIIPKMHLTVYHCRRPMPGLTQTSVSGKRVVEKYLKKNKAVLIQE